jgi:hypothetical protein
MKHGRPTSSPWNDSNIEKVIAVFLKSIMKMDRN